jgi:hypothetical protein
MVHIRLVVLHLMALAKCELVLVIYLEEVRWNVSLWRGLDQEHFTVVGILHHLTFVEEWVVHKLLRGWLLGPFNHVEGLLVEVLVPWGDLES